MKWIDKLKLIDFPLPHAFLTFEFLLATGGKQTSGYSLRLAGRCLTIAYRIIV